MPQAARHPDPDSVARAKPLHILHVVSGDLWAGAEVQVWQLLRAAAREPDLRISAVVLNPGRLADELKAAGVAVRILDEGRLSFLALARELVRHVRQIRPQVIHTHRRKEHLLGALAAQAVGAGLVATIHGRGEFQHPGWNLRQRLLGAAERLVLTHAHDRLIAVADDLAAELPGGPAHGVVIPNGIDVAEVRRAASAGAAPPPADARRRLLFLGRLVPVKQVDRLIEAMALLEAEQPGTYALDIIGDGPLRPALERQAARLPAGLVRFHGFLPHPLPRLAQADLLLFASAHEGLPMTALEALALGVPIIAPPLPSLARLAMESAAVGLAASAAPPDLAKAILAAATAAPAGGPPPASQLPQRYAINQGAAATAALWRQLS